MTTSSTLSDRYGTKPTSHRRARLIMIILVILLIATGAGIAYYAYSKLSNPDIEGSVSSFAIIDDSTVQMRFLVNRKSDATDDVCVLRVRTRDGSESGRRQVLIPKGTGTSVLMTSTVKSSLPAGVGEVYGCSTSVPSYLLPQQ